MTLIKIIIFTLIVGIGITFFILDRNGANLFQSPGVKQRLQVYLTSNIAKTALDHKFNELQPPVYDVNTEQLYNKLIRAATELRWEILANDSENQNANFVVRSPMFLFEDDLYVQVVYVDVNKASLSAESHSRSGRADFAANAGHIQALFEKLKE